MNQSGKYGETTVNLTFEMWKFFQTSNFRWYLFIPKVQLYQIGETTDIGWLMGNRNGNQFSGASAFLRIFVVMVFPYSSRLIASPSGRSCDCYDVPLVLLH